MESSFTGFASVQTNGGGVGGTHAVSSGVQSRVWPLPPMPSKTRMFTKPTLSSLPSPSSAPQSSGPFMSGSAQSMWNVDCPILVSVPAAKSSQMMSFGEPVRPTIVTSSPTAMLSMSAITGLDRSPLCAFTRIGMLNASVPCQIIDSSSIGFASVQTNDAVDWATQQVGSTCSWHDAMVVLVVVDDVVVVEVDVVLGRVVVVVGLVVVVLVEVVVVVGARVDVVVVVGLVVDVVLVVEVEVEVEVVGG